MATNVFNPFYVSPTPQINAQAGPSMAAALQLLQQRYGTAPQYGNTVGDNGLGKGMTTLGGVTGLMGQIQGMNQEWKNLQFSNANQGVDAYGRPTYGAGQLGNEINTFKPQGATAGEILSGIKTGASAGAAFGLIGAGAGAAIGAVTSLLGGRRRRRKQREKLEAAKTKFINAQEGYNQDAAAFEAQENQQDYFNQLNNDYGRRVQNLYR